jgi:hypothetical protein
MARKPAPGLLGTLPEPVADVAAQVAAVTDPRSAKTSAYMAKGTKLPPSLPPGLVKATRREGTLVTNNPQQARQFAKARTLTDGHLAKQLGYPESKRHALASSGAQRAVLVQGRTPSGAVAHESVASPAGVRAAAKAAAAAVPGGRVVVTSPLEALFRRAVMKR